MLAKRLGESAQQVWLAGVGAFGRAQAEGTKLFETLVKEGLSLEQVTRKAAGGKAQAMRDADRRKDEFLATLAHELRNPLAPIRNSIHILRHGKRGAEQARHAACCTRPRARCPGAHGWRLRW